MPYVINDMSLCIQPGEYLGIVGSSGCGKSTLMRLLLGFEVPETGSVYFDEKDISNLDLPSLRRRIGVVLQNGSLFTGDILSNLSICAPWLTMDEAWDAARRAGLAEDIENMPMGMFTMLSDDGGGLSGGQKQRLLIARAIAAKPDILLFDEATSALDNQTQATVVQTLKEMECTRLVIAHRLSTIMDCDRIIYLEKGHIVEQGTYEELMAQEGAFAKLAARQLA
jgi:ABC-type bacteriocin/lantibiotic exporter with double-glycine peptidase domain